MALTDHLEEAVLGQELTREQDYAHGTAQIIPLELPVLVLALDAILLGLVRVDDVDLRLQWWVSPRCSVDLLYGKNVQ